MNSRGLELFGKFDIPYENAELCFQQSSSMEGACWFSIKKNEEESCSHLYREHAQELINWLKCNNFNQELKIVCSYGTNISLTQHAIDENYCTLLMNPTELDGNQVEISFPKNRIPVILALLEYFVSFAERNYPDDEEEDENE